jgi:integrase
MVWSRTMLTDAKIKAAKSTDRAYKLSDSGQLYLLVTPAGGRHWRLNYTYGKNEKGAPSQKTLALGSYPSMTLSEARARRDEAKAQLRDGLDPSMQRRIALRSARANQQNTFEAMARKWHAQRQSTWSKVHAADVLHSLERDVFPAIGSWALADITAPVVLDVLERVERRGAVETAHRLRQRISDVFTYALAIGAAETNPAASLSKALKRKPRAKPQPAITDLSELKQMMRACDAQLCRATTKFALRFSALTAARPNEVRFARWHEIEDLEGAEPLWRIPAQRMKGDQDRKAELDGDHLVPLSRQAVDVLKAVRTLTGELSLIFPSDRHLHKPISENTLRALLIRAGYYHRHVPHGFRAAFSTVMNDRAVALSRPADRAIIDLMLAHVPPNKVESAYNRAAFLGRRRELAQEWADLLMEGAADPVTLLGQPMR